ncbi:hypothetical protein EV182_000579 [Spiromyces aspiralis]|uniref:Uncharacterized protein n=1 Tax=Spiromyces aspiralis TaxID=68401 RepID=A0ACC1HH42_9FUNG|nr:hypothetical protein EV182_000579 [Spiromyces aspiralis]
MVDTKNPAIAAYLAEVARAKRKAQESREAREGMEEAFSTLSVKQGQTQGSREAASTARATYGIIESKDGGLELRLPPAPREPDPGDCCQSGCNPCILITYQEMLESYNKNIDKLREEYARLLEVRHHLDFAHPIDSSGDNRPLLHSSTPSPSPSPSSVIASPVEASVPAIDASALITPLAFHNIRIHAVHNPSPFTIIFELEWTREQLPLVCGQHVHVRVPLPSRTGCYRSEDSEKPAQVITRPFTPVFRTDAAGVDRACLYIRVGRGCRVLAY